MAQAHPPFVCMDCGACAEAPGRCPTCGGDPLLDSRDGEIRLALLDDDERRQAARDHQMIVVAIPIALALFAVMSLAAPFRWLMTADIRAGPPILRIIFGLAATAFGLSRLLLKVFPAQQRFAYLRGVDPARDG